MKPPRPVSQKSTCFTASARRGFRSAKASLALSSLTQTYIGGKEKNRHASKRQNLGRGPVGKAAVVGAKDRATNRVKARVTPTLHRFVRACGRRREAYRDGTPPAYKGLENETPRSVRSTSTVGIESFWSMLSAATTYHQMSAYSATSGRAAMREMDTIDQAPRCRRDGRKAAHVQGAV